MVEAEERHGFGESLRAGRSIFGGYSGDGNEAGHSDDRCANNQEQRHSFTGKRKRLIVGVADKEPNQAKDERPGAECPVANGVGEEPGKESHHSTTASPQTDWGHDAQQHEGFGSHITEGDLGDKRYVKHANGEGEQDESQERDAIARLQACSTASFDHHLASPNEDLDEPETLEINDWGGLNLEVNGSCFDTFNFGDGKCRREGAFL